MFVGKIRVDVFRHEFIKTVEVFDDINVMFYKVNRL